jgi:uncharacterized membrane protein
LNNSKLWNITLLIASTLLGAVGQLLFKYSFSSTSLILWICAGAVAYVVSTLVYLVVLSRSHLSWTYGLSGLSYIFTTIFAAAILLENVSLLRWAGVGIIFIGVVLIGFS